MARYFNKNALVDGKHDAEHMLGCNPQYTKGSASYREYMIAYHEHQPKFCMPEYVLQSCFHRKETADGLVFWRECTIDGFAMGFESPDAVGYLVLYADGEYHHTYHHPDSFL